MTIIIRLFYCSCETFGYIVINISFVLFFFQESLSEYDMEMFRLDLLVLSRLIQSVDNIVFELM